MSENPLPLSESQSKIQAKIASCVRKNNEKIKEMSKIVSDYIFLLEKYNAISQIVKNTQNGGKILEQVNYLMMETDEKDKRIKQLFGEIKELKETNNKLNNEIISIKNTNIKLQELLMQNKIIYEKEKEYINANIMNLMSENDILRKQLSSTKFVSLTLKFKQKVHKSRINCINFSSKNSSYVISGADSFIKIYSSKTDSETKIFNNVNASISEACLDCTNKFVFAGCDDKTAKLFSVEKSKLLSSFSGNNGVINAVKCLNYKEGGISGARDGKIKFWDFNSRKMVRELNGDSGVNSLSISKGDSYLISGHDNGCVKLWGIRTSSDSPDQILSIHKEKVLRLELIKGENSFVSLWGDNTIKLNDVRKGGTIYSLDKSVLKECCKTFAVSGDKKYFAVGSEKGKIIIIDLATGNIVNVLDNKSNSCILSVCWGENDSKIYVGDSVGYLTVFQ